MRILEQESFGAALLYFTGSKEHNVALRGRANKMGYTLNEYARDDSASGCAEDFRWPEGATAAVGVSARAVNIIGIDSEGLEIEIVIERGVMEFDEVGSEARADDS